MLWSSNSIPGKPTILLVDASCNRGGWEFDFCDRLYASMKRRGLLLKVSAPVRVERPEELLPHLEPQHDFNCMLLFDHGEGEYAAPETNLTSYWTWLNSRVQPPGLLFAACMWESFDPTVSQEILGSGESFAPLALAPQTPLTPREAGLFFLKFFIELDLHSGDAITGRMVWFACSKARELLRRRRLTGKVGARC